jgi:hypothetical protein
MDRRLPLACLLIVVGMLLWRRGVYFFGALDPVVMAKAVLAWAALLVAVTAKRTRMDSPHRGLERSGSSVSTCASPRIGAWSSGDVRTETLATRPHDH